AIAKAACEFSTRLGDRHQPRWATMSGLRAVSPTASPPVAHRPANLAVHFLFLDRFAFVVVLFAAGDADFDLGAAVFEVDGQGDERGAALLGGGFEFVDLPFMREKFSRSQRLVTERSG